MTAVYQSRTGAFAIFGLRKPFGLDSGNRHGVCGRHSVPGDRCTYQIRSWEVSGRWIHAAVGHIIPSFSKEKVKFGLIFCDNHTLCAAWVEVTTTAPWKCGRRQGRR